MARHAAPLPDDLLWIHAAYATALERAAPSTRESSLRIAARFLRWLAARPGGAGDAYSLASVTAAAWERDTKDYLTMLRKRGIAEASVRGYERCLSACARAAGVDAAVRQGGRA